MATPNQTIKGAPLANSAPAQIVNAKAASRPAMVTLSIVVDGQTVATLPGALRTFTSGKKGYFAGGKTMLPNGEPLQVSCNLVIPHSES